MKEEIESTEVSTVKADVAYEIEAAQVGGLYAFNEEERAEWLGGIEACETLEIALSVYDYLADFIHDGMEVVAEIQDKLSSGPLAQAKREAFIEQAQIANFSNKQQMISEITGAVQEARELQNRTLALIGDQALSVQEREEIIQKLSGEGASAELVATAAMIVRVARERARSRRAVLQVEDLLNNNSADSARIALSLSFGSIPLAEYIRLEESISQLQIRNTRLIAA